jgi:hypothetical protein
MFEYSNTTGARAMPHKFRAELKGYFHTVEIYDSRGREVFDLEAAAQAAEQSYGADWASVFNGSEAITREDWKNENN